MGYLNRIPSLLLLFFLGACNWNTDNSVLLNQVGSVSTENAVAIIHYNNGLVELTDAQLEYVMYVNRNLKIIEEGLQKPGEPIHIQKITDVFYYHIKELKNVNEELPFSAFEKSHIQFFQKNVEVMNQTFEEFRMQYQNLEQYILSDEYLRDKGKEGKVLFELVKKLNDNYYQISDLVMLKILELSDGAENQILKDHPLKEYIFKMRDCSGVISDLVDLAHNRKDFYAEDIKIYQKDFEVIKKWQIELSSMEEITLEEYSGKRSYFEGYIDALNDFLITCERVMKDSEKAGKISKENVTELLASEEFMREFYNDFVD